MTSLLSDSLRVVTTRCKSLFSALYLTALSIKLNITFVKCISSTNTIASSASIWASILPPAASTFNRKVFTVSCTSAFASTSLLLNVVALRSNIDICNTFSTWKRKRLVSSTITPEICLNIVSLFATEGSRNIWAANEMVDIGVLNSCVMLFMKSFFISDKRFWRKIVQIVKIKTISNNKVKIIAGIINLTLENKKLFMSGKWI